MNLQTHFLFPLAIGLLLTKFGIINFKLALLCGVMGMIIDIDHYIEHILHAKSNRFSLRAAWNNSIKLHRFNQRSFVHYWVGALILSILFAVITYFSWSVALVLAIGYYSHLLLDFVFHLKKEKYFRKKIEQFYLKESYLEIMLDLILVLTIIFLLWL